MNALRIAVVSFLLLVSVHASAASDDADLKQCLENVNAAQCLWAIHALEDKRLNEVYKRSMQAANENSPSLAATLKKSEQAWIKFRDEWCKFVSEWEGGTLTKTVFAYCNAELTRRRADELTFYSSTDSSRSRFAK